MTCDRAAKKFEEWYAKNKSLSWLVGLDECPCTLDCVDKTIWKKPGKPVGGYHKGAEVCMRSKAKGGHANQCCYKGGKLCTAGSGCGSADKVPGTFWTFPGHKKKDMAPADWGTRLDGGKWGCWSKKYLERRPQVGADKCPSQTCGDTWP